MRILFCSSTYLSKELGASKVLIELAEEMERLGWECDLVSPPDLVRDYTRYGNEKYPLYLRRHLLEHGSKYDVVDYDHHYLPFPRSEFPQEILFVARSVLLQHHLDKIAIPHERSLKSIARTLLRGRKDKARRRRSRRWAYTTLREADFINVLNYEDKAELVSDGIPREKIAVIPNGLSRARASLFGLVSSSPPYDVKVAFVGTFDNRKGATDFPAIVRNIREGVPDVSFRLLGTFRNEEAVLAHFPRALRSRVEVIPHYNADELPQLLAPCSVGVFPSYVEGFGLGVLEMLAASIPVIAYNSPGPPMMLPPDYLVAKGDVTDLANKVINLLRDRDKLAAARVWAKQRSRDFRWKRIAEHTSDVYYHQWQRRQMVVPT
jgi:glycosyltransferase involved in cell wall biosynthesis